MTQVGRFVKSLQGSQILVPMNFLFGMMDMTAAIYSISDMSVLATCVDALKPEFLHFLDFIVQPGQQKDEFVVNLFQDFIGQHCPH